MPLALIRNSVKRPLFFSSPASSPHLPTYHFLFRDCVYTCGWSGGEGRDASSTLGSGEAGDGGMDKATRAAIAHAYEVDRGGGGGESGAREGGEGRGEGGVRAGG